MRLILKRLIFAWLVLLSLQGAANAQSSVYDPYGQAGGPQTAAGAQGAAGSQGGGGYASQPGQAAGTGVGANGYYSMGGAAMGAAGYTPTVITNPFPGGAQSDQDIPLTPLTRPITTTGAIDTPLYARPGATPGQFELFTRPPPEQGEFEAFVARTLDKPLPRFGTSLILNGNRGFATPANATVPPDYRLNPGDELIVGVTGAVIANLRLVIDREGRIFIPQIGPVNVAGTRYGDLADAISRRFSEQYKQAKISVVIGRLHGITVYVTGYPVTPGAYTVSSLSTMVDAVLAAGGPGPGGSFRFIELQRNGKQVASLDLYDLLLKGDKSHDAIVENEDVINIRPAGAELAISGSVNAPAIYEAKPGDTLADVIGYAGGLNPLADRSRLVVVRLGDLDAAGSRQLTFDQAQHFAAEGGDLVRVLSLAEVIRPQERQAILATIDGEVDRPGRYYLPPGAALSDLLKQSGGLTSGAFVFGTQFVRESVRRQQQQSFDAAIHDLEVSVTLSPLSGPRAEQAAYQASSQNALQAIQRLRDTKPDGRIVLDLPYGSSDLPGRLTLQDGDHVFIPPVPSTVGVFGAVYAPGSFVFRSGAQLADYLKLAGGSRRFADRGEVFVVRASGQVISNKAVHNFDHQPSLPGDVIFVPARTTPGPFERVKEIATVVFQLGLSAATLGILAAQL
jgi:polysaccharide biosynthesis/export protein